MSALCSLRLLFPGGNNLHPTDSLLQIRRAAGHHPSSAGVRSTNSGIFSPSGTLPRAHTFAWSNMRSYEPPLRARIRAETRLESPVESNSIKKLDFTSELTQLIKLRT